mmetsp:Transcript_5984/g.14245  ORF Transcript_5984/g.14245 Transcript_5984/m.14245 type:complete len:392 (-) Transcript_5984:75-1250(-)
MSRHVKKGPVDRKSYQAAVKRINEQLEHARASKAKLEARSREYEELKAVLEGLPERVSHPVMVPFGPLAFFEGCLEHTNEVLSQLSSEYFVLRTTQSALEMVGRRQERLRSDQADVTKELDELQMRRRLAGDEGAAASGKAKAPLSAPKGSSVRYDEDGFLDIREPYVEDDNGTDTVSPPGGALATESQVLGPGQGAAGETGGARLSHASAAGSVPVAVPAPAPPSTNHDSTFARLRELEQMEDEEELAELKSLDKLLAGLESFDGSTPSQHREQALASRGEDLLVRSPADIFSIMSQTENQAAAAAAEAVAPTTKGVAVTSTPRHASPRAAVVPPRPVEARLACDIVERRSSSALMPSGAPECRTAQASGATVAQKRVSKFKADRQRGCG